MGAKIEVQLLLAGEIADSAAFCNFRAARAFAEGLVDDAIACGYDDFCVLVLRAGRIMLRYGPSSPVFADRETSVLCTVCFSHFVSRSTNVEPRCPTCGACAAITDI